MKKAFDQTVRDIKRGVNKKVLKVPSIEQKVLDATSNEPWGPHGTLLADIAQATRNYHEYQMIMSVIWKRVNDTGKNWRHVYKALTILEYLVAHGSERVIDEIREHAYQISTLSDFQYIDSSGRDQGNNVRKKSQSLVVLVNDKERIQEVRQKAAANKDKYRSTPMGGMYRPGSGGYGDRYDDDRYEGRRDDDRNGYGREREWGSRDDDRYGDSYGRERDRYGRDNEERFGRDGYRDDDYRGRSQSIDDYNYGSRSKSADPERNRANEDDGQYSSRGSGAKADEQSQDGSYTGKKLESRYSGQSFDAPPSYEEAVGPTHSPPPYNERDGESSQAHAPKASSPEDASPNHTTAAVQQPGLSSAPASAIPHASTQTTDQHNNLEVGGFDEFDPRGSFSAAPVTSNGIAPTSSVEMDLLGSLSESFSSNHLALVPASQPYGASEANPPASFNSGSTADASLPPTINNQPFDDPFGDGPFRAVTSSDGASNGQQINTSTNSFTANSTQSHNVPQPIPQIAATNMSSGPFAIQPTTTAPFLQQESPTPNHDIDILADILPLSAPPSFVNAQPAYPVAPNQSVSHSGFPPQTNQPALPSSITGQNAVQNGFQGQTGQNATQNGFQGQTGQPAGFPTQLGQPPMQANYPPQTMGFAPPLQAGQAPQLGFHPQNGSMQLPNQTNPNFYGAYQPPQPVSTAPAGGYTANPSSMGLTTHQNFLSNPGSAAPVASHMGMQSPQIQTSTLVAPPLVSQTSTGNSSVAPKPSSDKFETKSTVWADTLSRGLVNLNISGSKTNPLADIGVDFDAINRKEKRMEKQPAASTTTSTVSMGKAMGSGSGIGRAGAGALRPQPNPVMGSGMNYNTAGRGVGMAGYGGSQPVGRGMGMGVGMGMPGNMGMGMGMGMNMGMGMGMGQGPNMQQPMVPPGSTMPGGYNPTMGAGNYGQQPYGGYR